jgi:hypothetical protein
MRTILLIFIFSTNGFSQLSNPKKLILDIHFNEPIRNDAQVYRTNLLDRAQNQIIDTVTAYLVVNYDPKRGDNQVYLKSSRASLRGDTLEILLFNHTEYVFWEYKILITKDTYQIETWFAPPINDKRITIQPVATVFKINSLDFVKGQELKGYTKLKGKCMGDQLSCFSNDMVIEGNFRVKIE